MGQHQTQLRYDDRRVGARSRPGRDCTAEFPELTAIAEAFGGRRVILDANGMTLRRAIGMEMRDERYDKLVGRSSEGGAETAADGRLRANPAPHRVMRFRRAAATTTR